MDHCDLTSQFPDDLLEDSFLEFTIPLLDLTSTVSFITSNRGKELMLYGGYKFGLHRRLASGDTSWSCCSRGCPARLRCSGDAFTVTKARIDHNHLPPKPELLERQKIYNVTKKRALQELSEQPRDVISAVLSEECVEQFTKDDVARVRKNLHRARRRHNQRLLKEFSDDLEVVLSSTNHPKSDDESILDNTKFDAAYEDDSGIVKMEPFDPIFESLDDAPSILVGNKGRQLLLYQGFKFSRYRDLASGEMSWRCSIKTCPAALKCFGVEFNITEARLNHNHPPPDPKKIERQKISAAAKKKAIKTLMERPGNVVREVLAEEGLHDISRADLICVRKTIYRARRQQMEQQQLREFPMVPSSRNDEDKSS